MKALNRQTIDSAFDWKLEVRKCLFTALRCIGFKKYVDVSRPMIRDCAMAGVRSGKPACEHRIELPDRDDK